MWIDTYFGPPDVIIHDAGTNFASQEFKNSTNSLHVDTIEVPVEAHNSVGKTERYHAVLRRAYDVLAEEIKDVQPTDILQMAVKAVNDTAGPGGLVPTLLVFGAYPRVNDTAGPDGLVPTLLVFGAYPRMSTNSPPSSNIQQRATAIRKAIKEVEKIKAERQVREALATRNGPDISLTLELEIGAQVLVYRENGKWRGPWTLLAVTEKTCTVDQPSGAVNFRITSVRPYHGTPPTQEEEQESTHTDQWHACRVVANTVKEKSGSSKT